MARGGSGGAGKGGYKGFNRVGGGRGTEERSGGGMGEGVGVWKRVITEGLDACRGLGKLWVVVEEREGGREEG